MAYLVKKLIAGKPYYYLRESKRTGNKVVSKNVAYFGRKKPNKAEIEAKLSHVVPKPPKHVVPKEENLFKEDKMPKTMMNIEEMAVFCKKKGFVYPSSEIYGGLSGFFDFGPLGVELFNAIKQHWWKHFVQDKENMVGIDASIISHPRIWKASGHIENFNDVYVKCRKCKKPNKLDKNEVGKVKCSCGGEYDVVGELNLMFKTNIGPVEGSASFLRPETAQGMFTDFKLIAETSRQKLPFGIAQVGKCFRNEISPRDFLFRSREFTIGEFEFFIHPDETKCESLTNEHLNLKVMLIDAESQKNDKHEPKETTIGNMIKENRLGEWHAYWLAEQMMWFYSLGLRKNDLKIREHTKDELSHYSSATFDVDYSYPFGSKEIAGNANRGQYDLNQHMKESSEKLELFDETTKSKIIPRVIEPTFGMERVFLAVLVNAYNDDKERGNVVLKLDPNLSPVKAGVFPLVNKLNNEAKAVHDGLKSKFRTQFDTSGSIGRRYARADEIGIPYCITIDFDTLKDKSVTIRNRDTTEQARVKIKDLAEIMKKLLNKEIDFKTLK